MITQEQQQKIQFWLTVATVIALGILIYSLFRVYRKDDSFNEQYKTKMDYVDRLTEAVRRERAASEKILQEKNDRIASLEKIDSLRQLDIQRNYILLSEINKRDEKIQSSIGNYTSDQLRRAYSEFGK